MVKALSCMTYKRECVQIGTCEMKFFFEKRKNAT